MPKDKKKRLVTTPEQNQWVIDRITESPESCANKRLIVSAIGACPTTSSARTNHSDGFRRGSAVGGQKIKCLIVQ